jgi:hypothetical protein
MNNGQDLAIPPAQAYVFAGGHAEKARVRAAAALRSAGEKPPAPMKPIPVDEFHLRRERRTEGFAQPVMRAVRRAETERGTTGGGHSDQPSSRRI